MASILANLNVDSVPRKLAHLGNDVKDLSSSYIVFEQVNFDTFLESDEGMSPPFLKP